MSGSDREGGQTCASRLLMTRCRFARATPDQGAPQLEATVARSRSAVRGRAPRLGERPTARRMERRPRRHASFASRPPGRGRRRGSWRSGMNRRVGASTASPETRGDAARGRPAGAAATCELLKPTEVADLCRCSVKTVMRAVVAGELQASQLGRRGTWAVRRQAIDEWLDRRSNRTGPTRPRARVHRVEADLVQQPPRRQRARRPGGDGRLAA
jgi:excisionase family DNA binding protein